MERLAPSSDGPRRMPRLGDLLRIAVILAVVLGAILIECTLYKAFDANGFRLEAPSASSADGLLAATSKDFLFHAPADRRR